jgi:hypothetical protein
MLLIFLVIELSGKSSRNYLVTSYEGYIKVELAWSFSPTSAGWLIQPAPL